MRRGERDYETNQRIRTILKKERLHIGSGESEVLYDRLNPVRYNYVREDVIFWKNQIL